MKRYVICGISNRALSMFIGSRFLLNAPYLSNFFKVEKGFNFSDYLVELRMKKAMELFSETTIKTYEVAEMVGYTNPQYFSMCFKKYAGYTPSKYRENH